MERFKIIYKFYNKMTGCEIESEAFERNDYAAVGAVDFINFDKAVEKLSELYKWTSPTEIENELNDCLSETYRIYKDDMRFQEIDKYPAENEKHIFIFDKVMHPLNATILEVYCERV